jgi:hypothetical protein
MNTERARPRAPEVQRAHQLGLAPRGAAAAEHEVRERQAP